MIARSLALVASLATMLAVAAASPVPGTPSQLEIDPNGWVDLLADAGPELKGWTRGPIPPNGKLREKTQWTLSADGKTLTCEGDGGHEWLRWDLEQGDFHYHVEWKFTPVTSGKKAYNSGVYVRNSGDGRVWHQAQVGPGPSAWLFGETFANGALKRLDFSKQTLDKRVRPAGDWNRFELTCRGKEVTLWVNGEVVNAWNDCEVARGYVGLEAEGYRIEFRNVKLKPL